jgi:hypothetical protein
MSALESMIFDPTLGRKYIVFCSEVKMQSLPGMRWRQTGNKLIRAAAKGQKQYREACGISETYGWRDL